MKLHSSKELLLDFKGCKIEHSCYEKTGNYLKKSVKLWEMGKWSSGERIVSLNILNLYEGTMPPPDIMDYQITRT